MKRSQTTRPHRRPSWNDRSTFSPTLGKAAKPGSARGLVPMVSEFPTENVLLTLHRQTSLSSGCALLDTA